VGGALTLKEAATSTDKTRKGVRIGGGWWR